MAVVAPLYHELFNSQKHIDEVGPVDLEPAVKEMAAMIVDAKADKFVALNRAHKHMDLAAGEKFLATWGKDHPLEVRTCLG